MSALEIYLIIKLDAIINLALWLASPAFVVMIISLIKWLVMWIIPHSYSCEDEWGHKPPEEKIKDCNATCKGLRKPTLRILLISLMVWFPFRCIVSLLPSTKEMAIIYVVPKIINDESVAKIPGKLVQLSSEWLEELRPVNIKGAIKEATTKE